MARKVWVGKVEVEARRAVLLIPNCVVVWRKMVNECDRCEKVG